MKKLIILFLIPFVIFAQNYDVSVKSAKNSTTTTLDSAATYTGTEELTRGYNSLSVTVRSDSAGTYKILFGNSTSITTANAIKTWSFSYTAGDTLHTKHVPIVAPYYKVVYTSSADTQNVFLLTTMLHQGHNLPTNSSAEIQVADATVEATLTNIEADADSIVDMTTAIHGDVDAVEAKLDSIDASSTRIETKLDNANVKLDSLDASSTRIEGYVDGAEAKLDSIDASSTRIEGKLDDANAGIDSLDASSTRIEGYTDGIETIIDSLKSDLATLKKTISNATTIQSSGETTVSTEVDTISFSLATDHATWTVFAVDDTLEASLDGSFYFPVPIYPYTQFTFEEFSVSSMPAGYIRRKGSVGTVTYISVWKGY